MGRIYANHSDLYNYGKYLDGKSKEFEKISSEMAELKGGTRSAWSHFARTGKVPAVKWIDDNWYFDPEKVDSLAIANKYVEQPDSDVK